MLGTRTRAAAIDGYVKILHQMTVQQKTFLVLEWIEKNSEWQNQYPLIHSAILITSWTIFLLQKQVKQADFNEAFAQFIYLGLDHLQYNLRHILQADWNKIPTVL